MRKSNKICFNLVGGIGNQLFIYFAGQYVEYFSEKKVFYRHITLSKNDSIHTSSILDLDIEINLLRYSRARQKLNTFMLMLDRRIQTLLKKTSLADGVFPSNSYFPEHYGYDENLLSNIHKKQIYGYFQAAFYYEKTCPNLRFKFALKNPSEQFLKDSAVATSILPIMLHIRRGDYVKNPQIGILSRQYYEMAIEKVEAHIGERQIWVFSDDIDSARNLLNFLPDSRFRFINTGYYNSDSESLALMTKGLGLITSNSTFSYWAGVFSKNADIIVVPSKWFRAQTDPEGLVPESWTKVRSSWANDE
jgi:hypothetical protein